MLIFHSLVLLCVKYIAKLIYFELGFLYLSVSRPWCGRRAQRAAGGISEPVNCGGRFVRHGIRGGNAGGFQRGAPLWHTTLPCKV